MIFFFFSSRRRHTRSYGDWSSDVCSSDLQRAQCAVGAGTRAHDERHRIALAAEEIGAEFEVHRQLIEPVRIRSEEHTSELQSPYDLVCRLLLEKKKKKKKRTTSKYKTQTQ